MSIYKINNICKLSNLFLYYGLLVILCFSAYCRKPVKTLHTTSLFTKDSGNVNIAIGQVQGKSYVARIKAIHKLGSDLTALKIDAIYKFLYQKKSKLKNLEFNALKNELVIILMHQSHYPDKLTTNLCQMYDDKSFGSTWRDYCIQFLGQWYKKMQTAEEREMAKKALYSALKETNNGIAGTTLIAMKNIAGQPGFEKKQITDAAQTIAADPKVGYISRIPALQISAMFGNEDAIITAREIIAQKVPVMLKMSAIAVIGSKGNQSDLPTLQRYRKSSDVRLRSAAIAALKKLNK